MREPHIIDAPKKTTIPRRLVFFDTESKVSISITDEEIETAKRLQAGIESDREGTKKHHDIRIVQATFWRKREASRGEQIVRRESDYTSSMKGSNFVFHFWQDVDNFTGWNQTTHVFAHNAKYDTQVSATVPYLVDLGYIVSFFSDSNPFILEFVKEKHYIDKHGNEKKKTKKIVILSSTNYFQNSLKQLGKTFGLPKLDFDHDNVDYDNPEVMQTALVYGRRDVEILETAMLHFLGFIEREDLGKFSKTVAGQAFAAYRHKFMNAEIYIHDNQEAIDVERRAYAGGRNECFSIGEIPEWIFYVDINSMYPHVMRANKYPCKLESFWREASIKDMRKAIDSGKLVCADVLVKTPYPIFHYKGKKLTFPIGTFWTSLSTPEIVEGLKRGLILEIKNLCIYEAADLFSEYVDYFYNNRLDAKAIGDDIHDYLYKLFMNSLYGKFGQKNENWEVLKDADGKEIEFDPRDCYVDTGTEEGKDGQLRDFEIKVFGGRGFKKNSDEDELEAQNSFPAIAAHVTAHSRMLLWSYIEAAWGHVHYCDTDSLFVDGIGYEKLRLMGALDNKRLGALKLESFANDLTLFGCKDYHFDRKIKMKGVSKNAVYLGKNEAGQLQYATTVWGGFSKRIKEGNLSHYYNEVMIKTLKRNYDKGIIQGGKVIPFTLDESPKVEADAVTTLCRIHGYPMVEDSKWYNSLPKRVRQTYFRADGVPVDEWCALAGVTRTLFQN